MATAVAPAHREHEAIESKLNELMAQDAKARAKHDKLADDLAATDKELEMIAASKIELLSQLTGLYKKHAQNGNGRKGKGRE